MKAVQTSIVGIEEREVERSRKVPTRRKLSLEQSISAALNLRHRVPILRHDKVHERIDGERAVDLLLEQMTFDGDYRPLFKRAFREWNGRTVFEFDNFYWIEI